MRGGSAGVLSRFNRASAQVVPEIVRSGPDDSWRWAGVVDRAGLCGSAVLFECVRDVHVRGPSAFECDQPGEPENPGSWNRYSYAGGDPVNRVDPTGTENCGINITIDRPQLAVVHGPMLRRLWHSRIVQFTVRDFFAWLVEYRGYQCGGAGRDCRGIATCDGCPAHAAPPEMFNHLGVAPGRGVGSP